MNALDELYKLYKLSNFSKMPQEDVKWDRPLSECSFFAGTMIQLADTYEGYNFDCLFIEKLVQAYIKGNLKVEV